MRVCPLLVLLPLICAPPANAWTIGGRFGGELDGLGESQRSYGVFDPTDLENPTLTRKITPQALLEVKTESGARNGFLLRLTDTARLSNARSRNSLLGETSWAFAANRLRFEGRWDVQGGRDEPAAGANGTVIGTWDRRDIPFGLSSQLRVAADWSRTSNPDLAGIFDYRSLKGHLQLSRDIGTHLELRALGGYRHKDAHGSGGGSYDETIGELEANGEPRSRDRLDATARIEDRAYRADNAGIPSSILATTSARYELRASEAFRPYVDQTVEVQDYRGESGIFQDHQNWKMEAGTDIFLNELRRRSNADLASELFSPDWRLRLGGTAEVFRASSIDADSASFLPAFDSFGGVAGIAREGGESLWFDLSLAAGRRIYRDHPETQHLVFEGLNLSLVSSDYTYLSALILGQWDPVRWLRVEVSAQWDEEMHDDARDNFRLWIANLSLTHPF